jgi:hypothetical protein
LDALEALVCLQQRMMNSSAGSCISQHLLYT